jgi:hypothetical protein
MNESKNLLKLKLIEKKYNKLKSYDTNSDFTDIESLIENKFINAYVSINKFDASINTAIDNVKNATKVLDVHKSNLNMDIDYEPSSLKRSAFIDTIDFKTHSEWEDSVKAGIVADIEESSSKIDIANKSLMTANNIFDKITNESNISFKKIKNDITNLLNNYKYYINNDNIKTMYDIRSKINIYKNYINTEL